MKDKKNYLKSVTTLLILTIGGLLILTFIPPDIILGVEIKRANIMSDFLAFDDNENYESEVDNTMLADAPLEGELKEIDNEIIKESKKEESIIEDIKCDVEQDIQNIDDEKENNCKKNIDTSTKSISSDNGVVRFEWSKKGNNKIQKKALKRMFGKLRKGENVRIAVFGDSYIEGDIITSDIRQQLQDMFGGEGVGFVPITSQTADFRGTVKHKFSEWNTINVKNKKSLDSLGKASFFASGFQYIPKDGATVRYEATNNKRHLDKFTQARLFFTNRGDCKVTVMVNDTLYQEFTPDISNKVQQLVISETMKSVEFKINGDCDKFMAYGASLDSNSGVSLDNYSVRGEQGTGLSSSSQSINEQIDDMMGYDLIILQYGLNVLGDKVLDYSYYGKLMSRTINHIKRSFPDAAIMMFGIGDIGERDNGVVVTKKSAKGLLKTQRQMSEELGLPLWSIFDAMGGDGAVGKYVEDGLASKDYTHINFSGGRKIANKFMEAFILEMNE